MSPASRERKRPTRERHVRPRAISRTTRSGILADVLRLWDTVAEASDPLYVETFGSQFLGKLSETGDAMTGFESEPGLVHALLAHAERTPNPAALALARTMSVIATTEGQRNAAARATDTLLAAGALDPPWGTDIGRPTPGRCWTMADAGANHVTVLLEFSYAGATHALICVVDNVSLSDPVRLTTKSDDVIRTGSPMAVTGIQPATDPDLVLHDLLTVADARSATLAEADPAETAALIHRGIKATDLTLDPAVEDSYRQFRALALARCRLFPASAGADPMNDDNWPPAYRAWRPTSPGGTG